MVHKDISGLRNNHANNKHAHGPSSFWMQDPKLVFKELGLEKGDCFLDMGSGPGDFAIQAARIIGGSGIVYALDKWQYLIDNLTKEAQALGLKNVRALVSDITGPIPIKDGCVNVCLLSNVLHVFDLARYGKAMFNEIRRVLNPNGRMAIMECKKEDQPFGPPKNIRLEPEEIEELTTQYGFKKISIVTFKYNYMINLVLK